eukprot:6461452-Amphidinium_carterae.1
MNAIEYHLRAQILLQDLQARAPAIGGVLALLIWTDIIRVCGCMVRSLMRQGLDLLTELALEVDAAEVEHELTLLVPGPILATLLQLKHYHPSTTSTMKLD